MDPSHFYLPSAFVLGALHALEPGHAKTLTAAYLIGTKGTKRDALVLGLSVAFTHSIVVVLLAALGVRLGREAFAHQAMYWLQISSAAVVVLLGCYLLVRRWPRARRQEAAPHAHTHDHHDHVHSHDRNPDHAHHADHAHDHDDDLDADELAHARAHAASLPDYVQRGDRPTLGQIMAFGAAGGLVPCPAAVTVMLLAISINRTGNGLLMVFGFSLGLAVTLVGIGLAVVAGLNALGSGGHFSWFSRRAPVISAGVVVLSGAAALLIALFGNRLY